MWVGAGGGFGMWVCADLSGCVCVCACVFFLGGLCGYGFVPVVAIGVVATVVVGGRCCGSGGGGCAVVAGVVAVDDGRN